MRKLLLALLALAAMFLITACPTTTGPTEGPTGPTGPAGDTTPAPSELRAQALELKAKAVKYTINELLPDEYGAANASLVKGEENYGKANAVSKAAFEEAVAAFKEILVRGLPLASARERSRAEELREAGKKELADSLYAERFVIALAAYDDGVAKEASKAYEESIPTFERAQLLFGILYKKAVAEGLRGQIDERGIAGTDQGNFDLAEAKFAEIDALFDKDPERGLSAADEAVLRYNLVIQRAAEFGAQDKRAACEKARDAALAVTADSLAPEEFDAAEAKYNAAVALYDGKTYSDAGKGFDAARLGFDAAAEKAKGGMGARSEAASERGAADAARDRAAGVKAPVAAKPEFDAAAEIYGKADTAYNEGDYEAAKAGFKDAAAGFETAYGIAKAKMDKVQAALDALASKNAESEKKAAEGDAAIGGGK